MAGLFSCLKMNEMAVKTATFKMFNPPPKKKNNTKPKSTYFWLWSILRRNFLHLDCLMFYENVIFIEKSV